MRELEQLAPFVLDLDFKAVEGGTPAAVELENGDLLIEGVGANYDIDREDEAFEQGAFTKAISKFLEGNAPLCYHHKLDQVIGKVIGLTPVPGTGIQLKAIVDFQPETSPLRHIYDGIKKGRINGLSCGGRFKRRMTIGGPRIHEVDLLEWSATAVPVGRGTAFSVVAGKAFEGVEIPKLPEVEGVVRDEDEEQVKALVEALTRTFADIEKRAKPENAEAAEA